jgi:acyl carrier protein
MKQATPPATEWPKDINPETLQEILAIISKEGMVERSAIVPEATLELLGLESIDIVTILMAVEEKLGIYVPIDNELANARNLSEFIAPIAGLVNAKGKASGSGGQ